jgi:hypothetical protein
MPSPRSRKPAPRAITCTGETDRLLAHLRLPRSLADAVASGHIQRTKVAESWLYHPAALDRPGLLNAALDKANELLTERLLVSLPQLAGRISATLDPSCTLRAARALLHDLVKSEKLAAIGLLTEQGEPYLALHRDEDGQEIDLQLSHLRRQLNDSGIVDPSELPEPSRSLADQSWSEILLAHAEFRCWGRRQDGCLVAWDALP